MNSNDGGGKHWHLIMTADGLQSIEIGNSNSGSNDEAGPDDAASDLDAEAIQEVIEFIEAISGISLMPNQTSALLSSDSKLRHEIMEWGVDDTETSGAIAHALARNLINKDWPTFAETDDPMPFIGLLRVAAAGRGYALLKPLDDDDGGIPTIVKQT